ncbi:hypothetical protein Pcal_2036 [Pyrobaculum calidifontis JCM 11548]|uniref:Polysaccharide biosynthesis protein n=1 Tax=Pyrobaculum calidifontis (strain DSM 21063 / JCM 11548 / VA1) TaxID=410359 RepID=A3MXT4_PYRCJ|nr:hypothetical protein Pcal_2036 [Pyrobaculum calidifontis JCM 11548]
MRFSSSRLLAFTSGGLALLASLVFSLSVSRRLPPNDLAVLNLVNSAYSIGINLMSYVTGWYPRVLAKDPGAYGSLFAAGLLTAGVAWAAAAGYLLLFAHYGAWDPALLALLGAMLVLYAVPAGAYLSVHRQRLAAALGAASQLVKIGGALAVRQHPTVEAVLTVNVLMSLPQALAIRVKPAFRGALLTLFRLVRGAPFQTLSLATTALGGLMQYVVAAAGGAVMLYYGFVLFQLSKMVYPALTIVPLMYGSLLTAADKERRALVDGAIILFLYAVPAAVMLKAPEALLAVLRPQELGNGELLAAMRLNAVALLLSGVQLHAWNVLLGVEPREILTLRDRPAKALLLDIAFFPANVLLTYVAVSRLGAVGLVAANAAALAYSAVVRLYYLPMWKPLLALYLSHFAALGAAVLVPPLPLQPSTNVAVALAVAAAYALYLAAPVATVLLAASPVYRQLALRLLNRRH